MAVNATAIWRVRPSGSNTNGGGYDPGIAGAATDYSQQNAAQATGTNGAGSATTTFTDATASAFTSAMVGNAINITGQGFYFVTAFISATQVTVDRALGTFSGATWHLGGGWADFWTNTTSSGPAVSGNVAYILGSGTPNPSSYTFDYTDNTAITLASGLNLANDPSTPGYKAPPDTTGGMPCIKVTIQNALQLAGNNCSGLWFVFSALSAGNWLFQRGAGGFNIMWGCVFDQNAIDAFVIADSQISAWACEFFSSSGGSGGSRAAINGAGTAFYVGNNIHDCVGFGFSGLGGFVYIQNNIIAKNGSDGISTNNNNNQIIGNTIDGNAGNGINFSGTAPSVQTMVVNNIITNQTGVGKFGLVFGSGTATANSLITPLIDYNSYYNNTANYSAINAGPHDTALGTNPYVGQSTENYALA